MNSIPIKNEELKAILDEFLQALLKSDRSKYPYTVVPNFSADEACDVPYLEHMQGKKVDGFPERTNGIDLNRWSPPELNVPLKKLDFDLMNWSGCRNSAVKMLYPKGGYMGWHHNANAPGYNILLSWSKEGKGYFRYQDPKTKEIVTMHDTPGWTCKVGYYGPWHEPDRIYWHCANAKEEERFTLGYIIPHIGLWQDMVDDIQS